MAKGRCCGTCGNYEVALSFNTGRPLSYGECTYQLPTLPPLPIWVWVEIRYHVPVKPQQGEDCPCWAIAAPS